MKLIGGLAERSKAPVSKTGWGEIPSQVQILYPPPVKNMPNETIKLKIRNENDVSEIEWQFRAPDIVPKKQEWLWALGILAFAIVVFSILLKNYLLIVIIALVTFIIYASQKRGPESHEFRLDKEGLHIDGKLYLYEKFESFWIFPAHADLETGATTLHKREFAMRFKHHLLPLLIIPFHNNNESPIRRILDKHLPQNEEQESLIDLLRKRLF